MMEEFKKFLVRGNLADMAIGFTVGAAFTAVAKSLVDDMIMPVVGLLIGRVDFEDFFLVLDPGEGTPPFATIEQAQELGAVTVNYGVFINNLLALVMVGIVMFFAIRSINRFNDSLADDDGQNDDAPEEPDNKKCRFCRTTIPYRATKCPNCTSALEPRNPSAEPA